MGSIFQLTPSPPNAWSPSHECWRIPCCRDCASCHAALAAKSEEFRISFKIGRTHTQSDPLTLAKIRRLRASGSKRGSEVSRRAARHYELAQAARLSAQAENTPAKALPKVAARDRGHHRLSFITCTKQFELPRMNAMVMFSGARKPSRIAVSRFATTNASALGSRPLRSGRADLPENRARIVPSCPARSTRPQLRRWTMSAPMSWQ